MLTGGGVLTWIWQFQATGVLPLHEVHIGAKYNNANGVLLSESVRVPEPAALSLLGLGLLAVGLAGRR